MEKLSEDCLIEIYKYLDILSFEIINLRTTSKFHNKFMRKKIVKKINKYTFLENESFFQKSATLHIFQRDLLRRIKETSSIYERDNLMMLLDGGWL